MSGPAESTATEAKPRLAVQAFWLMAARTSAFIITLALPLLMVRLFGNAQFGAYKKAFVLFITAQTILPFSVGMSAFYFLPRLPKLRRELIFNIVVYYAVAATVGMAALVLWPGILTWLLGSDTLTRLAPLMAAIVWTVVFSSFLDLVATANQDVFYSTAFIVVAQLSRGIMIVCAAAVFRTVEAVLYATLVQGVIQSLVMLWYLHHRFPYFWRYRNRELAFEQMRYVVPIGITGLLYGVQMDLHNYIVANKVSEALYAIYAVGTSQVPLIGILRDSINAVMQSRMSKLQQDNDHEAILQLTLRSWRTLAMVFLPSFTGLLLLSHDFITALYTTKYTDSVPVFRLNLLLLPMSIFITDAVVRAFAEYRLWFLRLRIYVLVGQLILSLAAVPYFGMSGALIAMLVALVAERIANVWLVFRVLGFGKRHWPDLWPLASVSLISLGAGVVMVAVLALLPTQDARLRLISGISIYGLVYVAAVIGLGLLNEEEKSFLNRFAGRVFRVGIPRLAAR